MKVFITGGTGLVGQHLIRHLLERGDEVTCLSRDRAQAEKVLPAEVTIVAGNPVVPGDWQELPALHEAVVNLAGQPVFAGFWTKGRKRQIRRSRLSTTFNVVESLERADQPVTLINASATGYYGDGGHLGLGETAQPGDGFLARLACEWEHTARQAESENVRVVIMRLSVVLATEGGALPEMMRSFNMGFGGHLGNGRQYFPWIHIDDLVAAILFALDRPDISGPVNAAVPTPPTQREFTEDLARAMGKRARFSVPGLVLKMVLGEKAGALLESRRVIPNVLKAKGFKFRYDELPKALDHLLK